VLSAAWLKTRTGILRRPPAPDPPQQWAMTLIKTLPSYVSRTAEDYGSDAMYLLMVLGLRRTILVFRLIGRAPLITGRELLHQRDARHIRKACNIGTAR
jgi:hypothetical protein